MIVKKLTVDEWGWPNPSLALFKANLQAIALSRNLDAESQPIDKTLPDSEFINTADELFQHFNLATGQQEAEIISKRPATDETAAPRKVQKKAVGDVMTSEVISQRVKQNELKSYTVEQLKQLISGKMCDIPGGAKKPQLIELVYFLYADI